MPNFKVTPRITRSAKTPSKMEQKEMDKDDLDVIMLDDDITCSPKVTNKQGKETAPTVDGKGNKEKETTEEKVRLLLRLLALLNRYLLISYRYLSLYYPNNSAKKRR